MTETPKTIEQEIAELRTALTAEQLETSRLREALIRISLTDWYGRKVRQHPDGGLRGMAGMVATRALMGGNPSYLTNEVVIARFGDPRATSSEPSA